jgi:hypothetical protein
MEIKKLDERSKEKPSVGWGGGRRKEVDWLRRELFKERYILSKWRA